MSKVRSKTVISVGVAIATLPLTLAVVISLRTVKPVLAQSETASCKDIPSCGIAGIVVGIKIIEGIVYYVVKDSAGRTRNIKSSQPQLPLPEPDGDGVIRFPYRQGGSYTQAQCEYFAAKASQKYGRKYQANFLEVANGIGHCSLVPIDSQGRTHHPMRNTKFPPPDKDGWRNFPYDKNREGKKDTHN